MSAEANAMSVEVDTQATDDQLRQKIELNEPAATKEPAADGNHAAAEPAAEPAAPAAADEKKEEAPAPKPDEEKKEEEKKCKDKCKEKKEKKDKPADATKLGCAGGLRKLFSFGGKKGKKAKPLDPPATKVCHALRLAALPLPYSSPPLSCRAAILSRRARAPSCELWGELCAAVLRHAGARAERPGPAHVQTRHTRCARVMAASPLSSGALRPAAVICQLCPPRRAAPQSSLQLLHSPPHTRLLGAACNAPHAIALALQSARSGTRGDEMRSDASRALPNLPLPECARSRALRRLIGESSVTLVRAHSRALL